MRWAVKISESSLTERNLADLLRALGFRREESEVGPVLAGNALDACDDVFAAFEVAKTVRSALSGATQVDPKFQLGAVYDFSSQPPSPHPVGEAHGVVLRPKVGLGRPIIVPPKALTPEAEALWRAAQIEAKYQADLRRQTARAQASMLNAGVAKALALLAEPILTGEKLYKAYEIAEGHPNRRLEFQKGLNISASEFRRFADAVHNPRVSGD